MAKKEDRAVALSLDVRLPKFCPGVEMPEIARNLTETISVPDQVRVANPETYISPAAPPFLLQHGTMDPVVPVQMSIDFVAKLEQALGKDRVQLDLLEGAEHGAPCFESPENVERVMGFLDKHLREAIQ